MKYRTLNPWIRGNNSVTPQQFFNKLEPSLEYGGYLGLDEMVELHLADEVDTGNLEDAWKQNREYIKYACEIAGVGEDNDYDLDNEERRMILDELGEPPESVYNIYFITIYNNEEEKLMYIGKTDAKGSRFKNGHRAALKLHDPIYQAYNKRVYFGTVMLVSKDKKYLPLECITPLEEAKRYLAEMEAFLINKLAPPLNVREERYEKFENMSVVHIQNFCGESTFMHDKMIYG